MEQKVTEGQLKDIMTGILNPLVEDQFSKIATDIEDKVKAAVAAEIKAPVITGGTPRLEEDPAGGFKGLWHFARDVARADKTGGRQISKELSEWDVLAKAAGTGLNEGDDQYGGYLVPVEFRNQLMFNVMEKNDLLPRCTVIPMQTNMIEIPFVNGFDQSSGYVMGGVVAYWTDEEDAITSSRPKFGKLQLKLHKLACLAYASEEVLADSPQSMQTILQTGFTNAINFQYNKVVIRGTGAGQPQGLLASPAKLATTAETGQAAATILLN